MMFALKLISLHLIKFFKGLGRDASLRSQSSRHVQNEASGPSNEACEEVKQGKLTLWIMFEKIRNLPRVEWNL
jgi:hypothetical protein